MTPTVPLPEWAPLLYAGPGVREACLTLQDEHGVDVVELLALAWAVHHLAMDGDDITDWACSHRSWSREVVAPLRRARRAVIDQPALRRQIAAVEVQAELLQLERLGETVPATTSGHGRGPADAALTMLAHGSLVPSPSPTTGDLLAVIDRAARVAAPADDDAHRAPPPR